MTDRTWLDDAILTNSGERILFKAQFHWILKAPIFICALPFFYIALHILVDDIVNFPRYFESIDCYYLAWVVLSFLFWMLCYIVFSILITGYQLVVTNTHVMYSDYSYNAKQTPLRKIQYVRCRQSHLGRMLGYGSIIFYGKGFKGEVNFVHKRDLLRTAFHMQADKK
jgi:hypothetical protein